jgi:hypothetical protein
MSRAALVAAVAVLASCAVADHGIAFDEGDRDAHAQHMEEWCRYVAVAEGRTLCLRAANGSLVPGPSAPPLPVYSEACGYLPPVYGDDC